MANRFLSNIKINDAYTFPASDGTNGQVIKTDGSGNLSFAQLAADSASVMYKDTFTGDGSATAFTLANALNDEVQSNVYIDGVYQSKSTYSVSGTTLTFSTAPASGHEIEVISTTGINSGPTAIYTDTFTANGSATAFTLGQTVHDENQTIVFLNGVYQFKGTYTLSGTTLTLDTAPANGVAIEVMSIGSAYSGGDILYDHDFGSAGLMTTNGSGVYSITANNSANWNTAYGWGDHSTQSYATQSYVGTQISNLVDSSPATLNTLNELAAALGDDPNFATTTANSIGLKAPLASPTFTGFITTPYIKSTASGNIAFGSVAGISRIQGNASNDIRFLNSSNQDLLTLVASHKGANFAGNITTLADKRISVGTWDNSAFTGGNAYGFSITSSAPLLHLTETDQTNKKAYVGLSGGSMYVGGLITNLYLQTGTSGTTALSIDSSQNATFAGNVGIGGSASSTHTLDLNSSSNLALRFYDGATFKAGMQAVDTGGQMVGSSSAGDFGIRSQSNMLFATGGNTERMRITSSAECHVELSGTAPTIKATASNGVSGLRINITGQTSGQLFRIQEDGATKFQINENGNVGIGNTSPDEKLEISGTGSLYPNIKFSFPGVTSRYMKIGMATAVKYEFEVNGSGTYMVFKTEGVERMQINSTYVKIAQGKQLRMGDYFHIGSGDSSYMGSIGFNRDTSNGTIFNSSYSAYQMHNYQGTLKLQVYSSAGGTIGEHKFFNNGDVSLLKGISFNGDTANDNKLDDYEEGTFTPTLRFNSSTTGITYAGNAGTVYRGGHYTKVGRVVTFSLRIILTSKGSASGQAEIVGLPYDAASLPANYGSAMYSFANNFVVPERATITIDSSSSIILLRFTNSPNGNYGNVTNGDFNNNSDIILTGTYLAN